jgi:hypothetical protein
MRHTLEVAAKEGLSFPPQLGAYPHLLHLSERLVDATQRGMELMMRDPADLGCRCWGREGA